MPLLVHDLRVAVSQGDVDSVRHLINRRVDVNATVKRATPLGLAIYRGYVEIAEMLINAGADVNQSSEDHLERREPPLCTACRLGNGDVVRLLLSSPRIEVKQKDFFNKSALWLATDQRRLDLVEILVEHGSDLSWYSCWNESPLYQATRYKGRAAIAELLISRGCPVNVCDHEGMTPLYWSIYNGNRRVTVMLLLCGAKFSYASNGTFFTPRALTSHLGDPELADWLLVTRRNPLALKVQARNAIRVYLTKRHGQLRCATVHRLPLPPFLKDFLELSDFKQMHFF